MCSPGDRVERSLATFAFTSANQGSGLNGRFAVNSILGYYVPAATLVARSERFQLSCPKALVSKSSGIACSTISPYKLGSGIHFELVAFVANFHIPPGLGVMYTGGAEWIRTTACRFCRSIPLASWVQHRGACGRIRAAINRVFKTQMSADCITHAKTLAVPSIP